MLMRALKLPAFARYAEEVAQKAEREGWTFGQYLHHLAELEVHERRRRRIERYLKDSDLPPEKTLATLTALAPARQGREDAADALRRRLRRARRQPARLRAARPRQDPPRLRDRLRARFSAATACSSPPTFALVQRLLAAKRDLRLEKELAALDAYDAVILDDIGYVQQSRDEMEVLFTFLAERYERRSVIITSNVVFSEWDRIFKDPMTTAAAIDRLVHHAVILEMTGTSVRADAAEQAKKEGATTTTGTTTTTRGSSLRTRIDGEV